MVNRAATHLRPGSPLVSKLQARTGSAECAGATHCSARSPVCAQCNTWWGAAGSAVAGGGGREARSAVVIPLHRTALVCGLRFQIGCCALCGARKDRIKLGGRGPRLRPRIEVWDQTTPASRGMSGGVDVLEQHAPASFGRLVLVVGPTTAADAVTACCMPGLRSGVVLRQASQGCKQPWPRHACPSSGGGFHSIWRSLVELVCKPGNPSIMVYVWGREVLPVATAATYTDLKRQFL
jgi:hypothetical protein